MEKVINSTGNVVAVKVDDNDIIKGQPLELVFPIVVYGQQIDIMTVTGFSEKDGETNICLKAKVTLRIMKVIPVTIPIHLDIPIEHLWKHFKAFVTRDK